MGHVSPLAPLAPSQMTTTTLNFLNYPRQSMRICVTLWLPIGILLSGEDVGDEAFNSQISPFNSNKDLGSRDEKQDEREIRTQSQNRALTWFTHPWLGRCWESTKTCNQWREIQWGDSGSQSHTTLPLNYKEISSPSLPLTRLEELSQVCGRSLNWVFEGTLEMGGCMDNLYTISTQLNPPSQYLYA